MQLPPVPSAHVVATKIWNETWNFTLEAFLLPLLRKEGLFLILQENHSHEKDDVTGLRLNHGFFAGKGSG